MTKSRVGSPSGFSSISNKKLQAPDDKPWLLWLRNEDQIETSQEISKLCGGSGTRQSVDEHVTLSARERERAFGDTRKLKPVKPGEKPAKTALDLMPKSRVEALKDASRPSNPGNIQVRTRKPVTADAATTAQDFAKIVGIQKKEDTKSRKPPPPSMAGPSSTADDAEQMREQMDWLIENAMREYEPVKKVFLDFDADNNRKLARTEFKPLMGILLRTEPKLIHPMLMAEFWDEMDDDNAGIITLDKLTNWYIEKFNVITPDFSGFFSMDVLSEEERNVREVGIRLGLDTHECEQVWKEFRKWDADGSGILEYSEFEKVLAKLMGATSAAQKQAPSKESWASVAIPENRMKKFFKEIDQDGSGEINFEEFVSWYARYFLCPDLSPMEYYYKQLGSGQVWRRNFASHCEKKADEIERARMAAEGNEATECLMGGDEEDHMGHDLGIDSMDSFE